MIRLTGAFMVCAVCIWTGFSAADRLRRRRDFLESFVTTLSVLETEIVFGKYDLEEIFNRMSADEKLYGMYKICAGQIGEYGIKRAWNDAVSAVSDAASLTDSDIDAICALGSELGMSDINGQIRAIERTSELVSKNAAEAGERCARLTRVYRGCGVLSGAFAVLMLM